MWSRRPAPLVRSLGGSPPFLLFSASSPLMHAVAYDFLNYFAGQLSDLLQPRLGESAAPQHDIDRAAQSILPVGLVGAVTKHVQGYFGWHR